VRTEGAFMGTIQLLNTWSLSYESLSDSD
jgi:hypothetical protein